MTPRPQLSLCIPVCSEKDLIQDFHENLNLFFQRFPLVYEVLFAINPGQDQSLSKLRHLAERNPHYRIIENIKYLSRAQNIHRLSTKSQGDILVPIDLDLAVPLSEILKIIEGFFSNPEIEVIFGNRFKAIKNIENKKVEQNKLENFFMGVIKEKALTSTRQWKFADPFCPILGLRRSSFEKIEKDLRSSGWYWNQEVQRVAQVKELKAQEIPIYVGSGLDAPQRIKPPKSEAFHLLKFILFRI
jgi:hypothetical protein